jgi:two-component sensor histidine kinase
MEALFRMLPGPQPLLMRFGVTVLIVVITFAFRLGVEERTGTYGFVLFVPAIMAAALLFDLLMGLLAVALSIALVAAIISWSRDVGIHIAAMATFAVVGGALALISDGLRRALVRAHRAQQEKGLLLKEMTHRVKNKFATILSIIGLQARHAQPETRAALEAVAGRIRIIANVHEYLQLARHDALVDMSEYLGQLCDSLGDAMRELRPVTVSVIADPIGLPPDKALPVGLIVNELVTNAFKYAFTNHRIGHVLAELKRVERELRLTISDDGVGCPDGEQSGLGTTLVRLLAEQLGGSVTWESANPGCRVAVVFPAPGA